VNCSGASLYLSGMQYRPLLVVLALLFPAAACDAPSPDSGTFAELDGRVSVVTDDGAEVWFIDAGTNIAILELTPEGAESVVEGFIADGASAREIFATLAPDGAAVPAMLAAPHALRAVDGRDAPAFRSWGADGLYSSCPSFTADEWPDFVESTHAGYDQYFHVSSSNANLLHDSYAGARRYYATMCAVHTHTLNTPPDNAINYEGWRRTVGGTWTKLIDQDVPQGVRLRHWDDPGSDGWQWRVSVNQIPAAPGCSFVCNPGEHHTSQMWDWN
jgi:hypothetical protein